MYRSLILLRLLVERKRLVITVHDARERMRREKLLLDRRFGAWMLVRIQGVQWIAVSDAIKGQLCARGVPQHRIIVSPAYLSPLGLESPAVLPERLERFCAEHHPLLSIYGSNYFIDDGVDVYGFDLGIEAISRLRTRHPRIGMVILVPRKDKLEYQTILQQRAESLACRESVCFANDGLMDATPLWRRSHVHLRPSATDGDSLAVREALSLHVPVVASNAVTRPPGTILFHNRDVDGFVSAIGQALSSPARPEGDMERVSRDHLATVLECYRGKGRDGPVPRG